MKNKRLKALEKLNSDNQKSEKFLQASFIDSLKAYLDYNFDKKKKDIFYQITALFEKEMLRLTFDFSKKNHSLAARTLGISRGNFRQKIKDYDIK